MEQNRYRRTMIIVNSIQELKEVLRPDEGCAVAIGKFDGMHLGHRALLDEVIRKKEEGLTAAVVTFDPSPEVYFGFNTDGELLTRSEKRIALAQIGTDILFELPFNRETAATEPSEFVRTVLCGGLHARFIAAGSDLSFGNKGSGNFELLEALSPEYGYTARLVDKIAYKDRPISSTRIRSYIKQGRMEDAASCLGSPYSFTGDVVHGKALGRTIDIPTANIDPEEGKLLPPFGVYYSNILIDRRVFHGMTNIGRKPTVKDNNVVNLETYLYDCHEDLYGQKITVQLLHYRRPEHRFSDIEQLKETMEQDVLAGRDFFKEQ